MKEILYILIRENEIKKIRKNNNICFSFCPMVLNNSEYRIQKNMANYGKLRKIEKLLNKKFIYLKNSLLERKKDIYDFIL